MMTELHIILILLCVLVAMKIVFHLLIVRGLEGAVYKLAQNQKEIYKLLKANQSVLDSINERLYEKD